MSEMDLDALRSELDGFAKPAKAEGNSAKDQRIIAGFEEIERFAEEHGRLPQHGENRDIFERLYAVRLDRLRQSLECRAVLNARDSRGLLEFATPALASTCVSEEPTEYRASVKADEAPSDDELMAELSEAGLVTSDLTELRHVRSREEIRAAEEVAKRNPCEDFAKFRPTFERVQRDLKTGERQTLKYKDNAEVKVGDCFILDGQIALVASKGEPFINYYGRPDSRLRVIYDNGTECDLLVRSLQRALNKDKSSRRITEPKFGPLFSDEQKDDDFLTGFIYVLRSFSEDSFVAENRAVLHKIGVTRGDVKARIANAKKDPTYLLAEVEIVAIFKLANIDRKRLEALLHKFFASVRLDLELKDRFGLDVTPREWFLVPLPVINEAVEKLMDGSLGNYRYEPESARLVKV